MVLIGGLTSSLFLTLLVVPAVYSLFEGIRNRFAKAIGAEASAAAAADAEGKAEKQAERATEIAVERSLS